MKKLLNYILPILGLLILSSFVLKKDTISTSSKYKCMVQLINYTGEGAYVIVSVLDKDGNYLKTLQILGDDAEWYPDLETWWSTYFGVVRPEVDGITGATIAGGERSLFVLEIEDDLLDKGNQLRFETAVEDQKYEEKDVQLPLTTATLSGKFEGSGYIRYVRMIPSK
ncbi:MAG: DUF2271 domain-containing protein [Bacteroidota bacterium]